MIEKVDWKFYTICLFSCSLFAYLMISLMNCTVPITPAPNDQTNYPQLGPAEACAGLCDNLEKHDCPGKMGSPGPDERFGTEDDVSCLEQCEKSVSMAPWMLDKANCGAVAGSCAELEKCD